jgi:hypothetical protein
VVPELSVRLGGGHLIVEPIGRNIIGADGRVDITSFPSLNRMLLVRVDDKWVIKTDARIDWPLPWSKDAFLQLADILISTT